MLKGAWMYLSLSSSNCSSSSDDHLLKKQPPRCTYVLRKAMGRIYRAQTYSRCM